MIDIHTIWLGNKPSLLSQVCMNDWQKQGYSFRLWSEKDHQVQTWIAQCEFEKRCYQLGLYAFVSDFCVGYEADNLSGNVVIYANKNRELINSLVSMPMEKTKRILLLEIQT